MGGLLAGLLPGLPGILLLAAACGGAPRESGPRSDATPERRPTPDPALTSSADPAPDPAPREQPDAPGLLVMTYNVNFGTAGDPEILELIAGSGADLVLLQETTPRWEKALRQALARRYPYMAFLPSARRAGGLAFLSRHPLEPREAGRSPIGWFPAWRAIAHTPIGPVQLLNLHLRPPGTDGGSYLRGYMTSQEDRLRETRAHLELVDPDLPTIIAGDFNEDSRGRSLRHLAERGFDGALERFRPFQHTWRWQTAMGTIRWQLDHILAGPRLEATDAWVLQGGGSDHLPVLARVELRSLTGSRAAPGTGPAPAR